MKGRRCGWRWEGGAPGCSFTFDQTNRFQVVGWCKLSPVETCVEGAWLQLLIIAHRLLILKHGTLHSSFAFDFNLLHYIVGEYCAVPRADQTFTWVRGCMLKPDKTPVDALAWSARCQRLEPQ